MEDQDKEKRGLRITTWNGTILNSQLWSWRRELWLTERSQWNQVGTCEVAPEEALG